MGEDDAIISDELNHASLIDGIRLAKAKRFRYANGDMADLDSQGREDLSQLIHLLGGAEGRIDVAVEDVSERTILVSFRSSARTQDSREPYGLGEALDVLSEYARPDAVGGETDG